MTDLMRTRPMTPDEVKEVLKRTGDEAFLTPAERIAVRAEAGLPAERFYRLDQVDRARLLERQRVIPRDQWTRLRSWLADRYRAAEVEIWAAFITLLSAWWIYAYARSIR